jgi:hypothetical protein
MFLAALPDTNGVDKLPGVETTEEDQIRRISQLEKENVELGDRILERVAQAGMSRSRCILGVNVLMLRYRNKAYRCKRSTEDFGARSSSTGLGAVGK